MYALSNAVRIYVPFFLFLCVTFFSSSSLAVWQWDEQGRRQFTPAAQKVLGSQTKVPSGTTITLSGSGASTSSNSLGGLSAKTNGTIVSMGKSSPVLTELGYSAASVKRSLSACVRSAACAGRALGAGAVIYEGVNAWKDVYNLLLDDNNQVMQISDKLPKPPPAQQLVYVPPFSGDKSSNYILGGLSSYPFDKRYYSTCLANNPNSGDLIVTCTETTFYYIGAGCAVTKNGFNLVGFLPYSGSNLLCEYDSDDLVKNQVPSPVSLQDLDLMIDNGYSPDSSDFPLVADSLLKSPADSVVLSGFEPVSLGSTTVDIKDSSGVVIGSAVKDSVLNYSVTNNSSSSPVVNTSITEITNNYSDTGNFTGSTTSTTIQSGTEIPTAPSTELDFSNLPNDCSLFNPFCVWANWTMEDLDFEEPDLTALISEFEPDESGFNLGVGSGSCPAPISLNLAFIGQTVEVSYKPFCDFVTMIRPFILAAAYLFSAYLYIGVLRRG